ncbi:MAG: hypothetical protein ABR611_01940 [Chthoniobacterales bacterium]
MIEFFGKDKLRRAFFVLFVLSSIACVVATSWHYTRKYPGNPATWLAWLLCLGFLLATYLPARREIKEWALELWDDKLFVRVFVVLALIFLVSHVWNFKTAPWNQNGLFDDAAWDIYFAKKYIFTHVPFQAAFSDGIAREVVFHYYITFFFIPFGYNLLTFNIALLVLGLTTFIFTCLIVHELFRNYLITIVSGLLFNFLPFHFIQTFIGHRYAMAAPLITASLYFLMTAFTRQSAFRAVLSAILAALCVDSAIMGKQFVMCLFAAGFLYAITSYKSSLTKRNIGLSIVFVLGLLASMVPLIVFVHYNWNLYFGHEKDLSALFFQAYKNRASGALKPYLTDLRSIFFAPYSGMRLSMQDYVLIPFWYYAFLGPGLLIALWRKHFEIILLATVPIVGAFVSTAYDFRVLHAAPFWIISMAFALHALTRLRRIRWLRHSAIQALVFMVTACLLAAGWIPSVRYLYAKSKNPFSVYLLGQHDVPVARFIRDIVAGVPHPSARRRHQEFRRLTGLPETTHDAFVCDESGYAVTHLFLQDYDDRQIMSFCEQTPMIDTTEANLFATNKRVLANYNGARDVMLIWQNSSRSARTIAAFGKLSHLGSARQLVARLAGRSYSFYVLTIPKENIGQAKQELPALHL